MLIKTLLDKMGLQTVLAENGKQAVDRVAEETFDIILMDIQMPVMNGYRATQILRDKGITTPIIALTANAMKGDSAKCREAGCDDYLAKPIHFAVLHKMIEKHLLVGNETGKENVAQNQGNNN